VRQVGGKKPRLSQRLSISRKTQLLPSPPAFGPWLGVISSEFRRDLFHDESSVHGWLSCAVVLILFMRCYV